MQLAAYLDLKDQTVTDFAASVGISRQAVHRYMDGKRMPTPAIMRRIQAQTAGAVTPMDWIYPVPRAA